jgi:type II secretory pathway pseudopilin PulG
MAVVILGILGAVALPNYFSAVQSTRQKDAASQISQIQTAIQGYREEFLSDPSGWDDIARITPISTNNGSANGAQFTKIYSSNGGHYSISVTASGEDTINISALAESLGASSHWDIKSCLNTQKGLADIQLGGANFEAIAPNCE